jgi:hypothetical protein
MLIKSILKGIMSGKVNHSFIPSCSSSPPRSHYSENKGTHFFSSSSLSTCDIEPIPKKGSAGSVEPQQSYRDESSSFDDAVNPLDLSFYESSQDCSEQY